MQYHGTGIGSKPATHGRIDNESAFRFFAIPLQPLQHVHCCRRREHSTPGCNAWLHPPSNSGQHTPTQWTSRHSISLLRPFYLSSYLRNKLRLLDYPAYSSLYIPVSINFEISQYISCIACSTRHILWQLLIARLNFPRDTRNVPENSVRFLI